VPDGADQQRAHFNAASREPDPRRKAD